MKPSLFASRILLAAAAFAAVSVSFPRDVRAENSSNPRLVPIEVPPERRQMIGLRFATVEERAISDRIDTTGTVEIDEQRQSYVQTRFPGWIREVFANQTWQYVRKGEPLFTIYSPDLVNTENEYLIALDESRRVEGSGVEGVAAGAQSNSKAALDRLRLFGVSPREISRLERERKVRDAIEIDAPMSGYIADRAALANLYADPSTRLFTIASIDQVWVYAAVFQNQLGEIKVGDPVTMSVDSYPGRKFAGKVDYIWPALDSATRTARVRCVFSNPDAKLKLGMFVRMALEPRLGRGLVVPTGGVLRTGTRNVVFVDRGDGYLDPVEVELGPAVADGYVVRKGLRAGQRIVSSANFLIDSESQLQAAIGAYTPPEPGAPQAAEENAARRAKIDLKTTPSPPARGTNAVEVALTDASGSPIDGAKVSVTFFMAAMPAMGMTAMRAQSVLDPQGGGKYAGSLKLGSGGTWTVTLSAEKDGRAIAVKQFNMSVTGPMSM